MPVEWACTAERTGTSLIRESGFVMNSRPSASSALWFDVSGLSFKPVNDVGRMIDYRAADLLARAFVVWLATSVIGGAMLAAKISFVARVFQVPEFADHQEMGFLMACVLGLGVSAWFIVNAISRPCAGD